MKKISLAAFLLFPVLAVILGSPVPAHAQFTWPPVCQEGSLPIHNTLDPVVPFQHEVNYSSLVAQKQKSAFLSIRPVDGYGHCDFTAQEVFDAFALMLQQAEAQLVN